MNKIIITLSLVLISTTLSFSQSKSDKVAITWGEEQPVGKKSVFDDIIGTDESGVYIIKRVFKGKMPLLIEKYDNNMKLVKSIPSALGDKKKARYYEYATQIDGELILFSTFLDKKTKTKLLFAQSINKKSLKPSSKLIKVGAIEYSGSNRRNTGSFTYQVSGDDKRILIYYSLPFEKGENEKFSYHVFDKDLNLLWEKAVTVPYADELFGVADYQIQENGDMYLLSRIYQDKAKVTKKGKPNYHYQIIAYTNKGNDVKEYPIILKDKYLSEMKITINADGDIICGGFYSNVSPYAIDGSYFLKIDSKSKEIVSKSFKEFGLDFITQNMTDKQKKKTTKRDSKGKDVELYSYDLDNIILRDDGGAVLVGEQFFIKVVTSTDSQGNTTTTYHYFYNDIIVISINPSGEIDWTEKIAKRQHTRNDGGYYSSYTMAIVDDKMNFIFNDNVKNLASAKMTKGKEKGQIYNFTRQFKTSVAVLVQLDSDGRQVKEALFNAKEAELLIRPKVCEQVSDNELVIYGQKRKTERFGKIDFK